MVHANAGSHSIGELLAILSLIHDKAEQQNLLERVYVRMDIYALLTAAVLVSRGAPLAFFVDASGFAGTSSKSLSTSAAAGIAVVTTGAASAIGIGTASGSACCADVEGTADDGSFACNCRSTLLSLGTRTVYTFLTGTASIYSSGRDQRA